MKKSLLIVSTGGTGGHVIPAVHLSNYLNDSGYEVKILSDKRGLRYTNNSKCEVKEIYSKGLHSKNILFLIKMFLILLLGFLQSVFIFISKRPKALIAFGGYSSIPSMSAAVLLRIPIIIHEQNSVIGKANKLFYKFCKTFCITFNETYLDKTLIKESSNNKFFHTGIPLSLPSNKEEFLYKTSEDKIVITILGGSQGSSIFSTVFAEAVSKLDAETQSKFKVYHQCREENIKKTEEIWKKTKSNLIIKPFFNNIQDIIIESDVIISRSGSATINEINSIGRYAIYVPFAKAANNHQLINAQWAKKYSGADYIEEQNLSSNKISVILSSVVKKEVNLEERSIKSLEASNKNACVSIKEIIDNIKDN